MVFLDRGGVINHLQQKDITEVEGWDPISGSIEAINRFKKRATWSPSRPTTRELRNGITIEEDLLKLYEKMQRMLFTRGARVDGIFYCLHGPEANSICREPRPGLIDQIAKEFEIERSNTVMGEGSISDIRAAKMASAKPVLVRTGKGDYTMQHFAEMLDVPVYDDLAHFVRETLLRRH